MKKTLIILSLLIAAAIIAFGWNTIDRKITEFNYPIKHKKTVEKYSEQYSVPKELIYAVIKTESSFESDALSKSGAVGLMQIMPDTYEWIAGKVGDAEIDHNLLYTPEINIRCGTFYLDWLYSKYGNWQTALAAYNAGHGKMDTWIAEGTYSGKLEEIPYRETREYVVKVMNAKEIYKETYFDK